MRNVRSGLIVLFMLFSLGASSRAEDAHPKDTRPKVDPATVSLCGLIESAAERHHLPVAYFTRLIWRESRFRLSAQSPAGAQGVAQFMPGTAAERGLVDPFAAREALLESAAYLDELRATFGNLGLAAAAYNAGPGRVSRWRAGRAELPQETLNYVVAITGHSASDWVATTAPKLDDEKDFSCVAFAARSGTRPPIESPATALKPWTVILVGNPQRGKVLSEFEMVRMRFSKILGNIQPTIIRRRISGAMTPRFIAQVDRTTRADANALCGTLLRAGGNCFVLANKF